mmetsp:Transcript_31769/g.91322  ORF Transcript_31769/g.91322 Transcript_31769/m.91322 type:complete len:99 (-) Transcript_31769:943-1239(-)
MRSATSEITRYAVSSSAGCVLGDTAKCVTSVVTSARFPVAKHVALACLAGIAVLRSATQETVRRAFGHVEHGACIATIAARLHAILTLNAKILRVAAR